MDLQNLVVIALLVVSLTMVVKGQDVGETLEDCGCPDEWIRYNGSCYLISDKKLSFADAETFCEQSYGHLVHIDDAEENNFLKNLLFRMKNANYWIGAHDRLVEGLWTYLDTNVPLTFTDWSPGQPDTFHGHNEDCALFYQPHQYMWDDGPCGSTIHPICELRLPGANPIQLLG